jgi:hypothetical protein
MALHTIGMVTAMVTVMAVSAAPGCEQTDRRGFSWTAEVGESRTQVSCFSLVKKVREHPNNVSLFFIGQRGSSETKYERFYYVRRNT